MIVWPRTISEVPAHQDFRSCPDDH